MNPSNFNGFWGYNPYGEQDLYQPGSLFRDMRATANNYQQQYQPYQSMAPNVQAGTMQQPQFPSSIPPSPSDSSVDSGPKDNESQEEANKAGQSYDKWSDEAVKLLVELWREKHTRLESKNARKVWDEIARELAKVKEVTVAQCQRKIKYLKDKYQKAKDHNRRQTGGSPKTSPFYDELDSVLGCRDNVTLDHVVESDGKSDGKASSSKSSTSKDGSDDEESDEDFFQFAKGNKKRQQERTERKKKKQKTKKTEKYEKKTEECDAIEEDGFKKTLENLSQQGDRLTDVLQSMEKNQTEQLKLMNTFMQGFLNALSKE